MTVSYDIMGSEKVAKRIGELSGEFGVSIRFICMEQMKLFARDVIKKTGGDPRKSLAQQRKSGKSAISSDLNLLFDSDADSTSDFPMSINTGGGGLERVNLIKSSSGSRYAVPAEFYRPEMGADEMQKIHHANRTGSNGRVSKRNRSGKIGRYSTTGKYYVKAAAFRKYRASVHRRVGKLKAGWVDALEDLERKTGGKKVSGVPQWVRNQAPDAPQSGLIERKGRDVFLKAENRVHYGRSVIKQGDVDAIGRTRRKDLYGSMAKRMNQVVERYNKTR